MIEIFYKCINEKNLKEMSTYISEDCLIEDTLFSEKFKGKKAAMSFIEKLTESMGPDMKFRIREVYERPPFMARAIWHLEWRNMEIPLAYGCTFIDIKDEERKTIQMVQIITELKLKAGHLLLAIMKLMTLLLAKHPTILEWLTKVSPQRWVKKISRSVYFSSGISWKAF
ncbi:putative Nuclear transport factor 2 family protein [Cucumis melo var. makuwa]|uniref:Nuclear transport factor 2 family protein n=1 Tax=Cucumis melo var. makuwa TaxID=1194695 RepID=A0A5A7THH3_CUCMM|nr:putative Nuclear transport factor 2 family protein [Cucumis melo var. makuwa]